MRLFSYVVARDYGFAPNPFYGVCTLATCKPQIRRSAQPGDWIIGTGSAKRNRRGHLVYAMSVSKAMTFTEYWHDPRYQRKRPIMRGSKKQAFGDNIYCRDAAGRWHQADSHHSLSDGGLNTHNLERDTSADRILVGDVYAYWGGGGPKIPDCLRNCHGYDICVRAQGYKCWFPPTLVSRFLNWYGSLDAAGYLGRPTDWARDRDRLPPGGLAVGDV